MRRRVALRPLALPPSQSLVPSYDVASGGLQRLRVAFGSEGFDDVLMSLPSLGDYQTVAVGHGHGRHKLADLVYKGLREFGSIVRSHLWLLARPTTFDAYSQYQDARATSRQAVDPDGEQPPSLASISS